MADEARHKTIPFKSSIEKGRYTQAISPLPQHDSSLYFWRLLLPSSISLIQKSVGDSLKAKRYLGDIDGFFTDFSR